MLGFLETPYNYSTDIIYVNSNVEAKTDSFKSMITFSGGMSTRYRTLFNYLDNNEELRKFYAELLKYTEEESALKVDTILKRSLLHQMPYRFSITSAGTLRNTLYYINDSLITLSLSSLVSHDQVYPHSDSSQLNCYLDFSYADMTQLIFTFSKNILPISMQSYNKDIKNEIGEYHFSLSYLNKNMILVSSSYKIFRDVINKSDYPMLKKINDMVTEAKNTKILLKTGR